MPDTPPDTPDPVTPDPATAIDALMPELRARQREGWAVVAGLSVALVAVLPFLWQSLLDRENPLGTILAILAALGLWGIGAMARHTRRQHEAMIMPGIASALGLTYRPGDKGFIGQLPPRLLPKASQRTTEDVLTGQVGGRDIRFAEVKVETGGKNSSVLFDGVVMEFPNIVPMPAFFVAVEGETRGWLGTRGNLRIDDLVHMRSIPRGDDMLGVWVSATDKADHPAFHAVIDVLARIDATVGGDIRLYSAISDSARTWVAIRQKRDLFRVGGLFTGRDQLLSDVRRAYEDMAQPLRLAGALLEAEAKAAKDVLPAG